MFFLQTRTVLNLYTISNENRTVYYYLYAINKSQINYDQSVNCSKTNDVYDYFYNLR